MDDEKYFGHTSRKKYSREDNLRFWKLKRDYLLENVVRDETELGVKHPATFLLDSSLITPSQFKKYTHKVIQCGKYIHVYQYSDSRDKKISKKDKVVHREKKNVNLIKEKTCPVVEYLIKKRIEKKNIQKYKKIDIKNINRSKIEMQRLIKTNEDIFKTFITLTFEDNVIDIDSANKKFDYWRSYIKKAKSDFAYVCVPEFQKRGAVHYHLLTNIDYTDFSLISKEEKKIYKPYKGWNIFRTLNSWSYGFSNVQDMKDVNVVGYLTKYMTKDIDDRLWGHRRYLYSQNLKKPSVAYLDLETANVTDFLMFHDTLKDYTENYSNVYADKFGRVIEFQEFKRNEVIENV